MEVFLIIMASIGCTSIIALAACWRYCYNNRNNPKQVSFTVLKKQLDDLVPEYTSIFSVEAHSNSNLWYNYSLHLNGSMPLFVTKCLSYSDLLSKVQQFANPVKVNNMEVII